MAVTDNFNRANENPLAGNWTTDDYSALRIVSNLVYGTVVVGTNKAHWNASSFANDMYCQVVVKSTPSGAQGTSVIVRESTSANTGYWYHTNDSTHTIMYKVVAGAFTQLGATYVSTVGINDTHKVRAVGTTLTPSKNGVDGATRTDSAIASGTVAIYIYNSGFAIDDFEAGDVSSTNIKSVNGLVKASIKSINGLAIASVKSWNGVV